MPASVAARLAGVRADSSIFYYLDGQDSNQSIKPTISCLRRPLSQQGDHLSGKPGNSTAVRDFTKSQGSVRGKNLVREKWPKTAYC